MKGATASCVAFLWLGEEWRKRPFAFTPKHDTQAVYPLSMNRYSRYIKSDIQSGEQAAYGIKTGLRSRP